MKINELLKEFAHLVRKHLTVISVTVGALVCISLCVTVYLRSNAGPNDNPGKDVTEKTQTVTDSSGNVIPVTETDKPLNSGETLDSVSGETTAASTVTEPPETQPADETVLAGIDEIAINEANSDGIVLLSGFLDVPKLANPCREVTVKKINSNFSNAINAKVSSAIKKLLPIAEADLNSENPSIPFTYTSTAEVSLLSDTAVCVLFKTATFTGGTGYALGRFALAYSISDGSVITFDTLFGDKTAEAEAFITEKIIAQVAAAPDAYYPDYEGLINLYGVQDRWFLTEEGLSVYYVPYEIANAESGVLTFTVSYGDLNSYLAFHPALNND